MSGASEIVLWLEEEKLSALRERNISVEAELQAALETLYYQSVPQTVREEIQKRLDAESARQKAQQEAQTVWAVYHVIEHGEEQYCRTSQPDELLTAANRLRLYLRKEPASRPTRFSNLLPPRQEIPRETYDSLIEQRLENTGNVSGVFEIDLDRGIFSAVQIFSGWQSYRVRDVCAAACRAFRKRDLTKEQRWERLLDRLDGRELTPDTKLEAGPEICSPDQSDAPVM